MKISKAQLKWLLPCCYSNTLRHSLSRSEKGNGGLLVKKCIFEQIRNSLKNWQVEKEMNFSRSPPFSSCLDSSLISFVHEQGWLPQAQLPRALGTRNLFLLMSWNAAISLNLHGECCPFDLIQRAENTEPVRLRLVPSSIAWRDNECVVI